MDVNTLSDNALIKMMLEGSAKEKVQAWKLVYKVHYPMVRDFISKNKGHVREAPDLFQEAMAILHNNILEGTFRRESSIKTYLYSISRNLWIRQLRAKEKKTLDVHQMIEELKTDVNNYLVDVEVVTLLMSELKEDCRNILTEFYFNSRSMEELKDIFNVKTVEAAKNKKCRCLNYLKRLYRERSIIPFRAN